MVNHLEAVQASLDEILLQRDRGGMAGDELPLYLLVASVVSLQPSDQMLAGIDALVYDIQDAGVRFYTFITTLGYTLEAAGRRNLSYFVLDRPNPIGGFNVEGPMLDAEKTSFVAYYPLPVRYALTIGELAQLYNTENHINAQLHVIAMKNCPRIDSKLARPRANGSIATISP